MFDSLIMPLGLLMHKIYLLTGNYGAAILVFTVIVKLILLPLAFNQEKGMAGMLRIRPKQEEIQKKYANNRVKMQEELAKLYQEENVKITAGCLPVVIQLPIILALYQVILRPLTFMLHMTPDSVYKLSQALGLGWEEKAVHSHEIEIAKAAMASNLDFSQIPNFTKINFDFFGLNLSTMPHLGFNALVLIPILSGVTALFSMLVIQRMQGQTVQMPGQSGLAMNLIMPIMSLWIAFKVPAGVGLYWIASNVISIIQTYFLKKYYVPKVVAQQAELLQRQKEATAAAKKAKKRYIPPSDYDSEEPSAPADFSEKGGAKKTVKQKSEPLNLPEKSEIIEIKTNKGVKRIRKLYPEITDYDEPQQVKKLYPAMTDSDDEPVTYLNLEDVIEQEETKEKPASQPAKNNQTTSPKKPSGNDKRFEKKPGSSNSSAGQPHKKKGKKK
jgi:YidC/Oxa1 family membrane protein insertase